MLVQFPLNTLINSNRVTSWNLDLRYKPDDSGRLLEKKMGVHPHSKRDTMFAMVEFYRTLVLHVVARIGEEDHWSSPLILLKTRHTMIAPESSFTFGEKVTYSYSDSGFRHSSPEQALTHHIVIPPFAKLEQNNRLMDSWLSDLAIQLTLCQPIFHVSCWLDYQEPTAELVLENFFKTSEYPNHTVGWDDTPADWGLLETKKDEL